MSNQKDASLVNNNNAAITTTSGGSSNFINMLKEAEKIADYVINSSTFGNSFKKQIPVIVNGKEKKDAKGNTEYELVKDRNDVITAIIVGSELGLSPMASISMGKKLDGHAFTKVRRGAALGIDPVTALDVIDVISTSNGDITHTGVHVVTKALLDAKVKIEILKDGEKEVKYLDYTTKEPVGTYDASKMFLIRKGLSNDVIAKAKTAGKQFVIKDINLVSEVKLTRYYKDSDDPVVMTGRYTLQQAIDAGLYKGTTTDGEKVDGKANWNNHPITMLTNRIITIVGRRIIADKLLNTYTNEEASEFTDYTLEDEPISITEEVNSENSNNDTEDN